MLTVTRKGESYPDSDVGKVGLDIRSLRAQRGDPICMEFVSKATGQRRIVRQERVWDYGV